MHGKWPMATYSGVEEMLVKEVSENWAWLNRPFPFTRHGMQYLMISPHQLQEHIPASFGVIPPLLCMAICPYSGALQLTFCTIYPSIKPRLTMRGHQYCPNHPKIFTYAVMSLSRDIHALPSSCIAYQEKRVAEGFRKSKDGMRALIMKLNDMAWWGRPPHHTKTLPRSLICLSSG